MRAAWYEEFGPARDVLKTGDMDTPEAGPGQVLVRVHASGINPLDVKGRDGGRWPMRGDRMIPHFDGAGVIAAVGEGVDAGRVGERVWLYEGNLGRAEGTAAEYLALDATRANPLPESQSFAEGACLGIPAMTAHALVYQDGPVDGQTILVTGAAGAVGNYAVQMARNGGATVIGTVSSDEKAARAARGRCGPHDQLQDRGRRCAGQGNHRRCGGRPGGRGRTGRQHRDHGEGSQDRSRDLCLRLHGAAGGAVPVLPPSS